MKIGVTGHQERDGISWEWVRQQIDRSLRGKNAVKGYSSLAAGTDQIFAECILSKKGSLIAVIPGRGYRELFQGQSLNNFDKLLAVSEKIELSSDAVSERLFLEAGKWIVRSSDMIVAVWDGEPAEGRGGTADIVAYALLLGKPVCHIDPVKEVMHRLPR